MKHLGLLQKGETAVISGILHNCPAEIRQRLLDLGFVKGTRVHIENISPLKDPVAYRIHHTQISLRREDASYIEIEINENEE